VTCNVNDAQKNIFVWEIERSLVSRIFSKDLSLQETITFIWTILDAVMSSVNFVFKFSGKLSEF